MANQNWKTHIRVTAFKTNHLSLISLSMNIEHSCRDKYTFWFGTFVLKLSYLCSLNIMFNAFECRKHSLFPFDIVTVKRNCQTIMPINKINKKGFLFCHRVYVTMYFALIFSKRIQIPRAPIFLFSSLSLHTKVINYVIWSRSLLTRFLLSYEEREKSPSVA